MKKTHLRRSVSALLICAMLLSLCGYTGTSIAAADADTPASVQRTYTAFICIGCCRYTLESGNFYHREV